MDKNRDALNKVLEQLVDPVPAWYLEPVDNQRSTLRVAGIGGTHTSEGMGEGFMSLLFIADALYDSAPGSLILLDQPEASLNMPLEQRLRRLLSTYAKDRQIVYATHSPYFTEWPDIWNGAQIVRTFLDERGCALAALRPSTAAALQPVGQDRNNPHALGVDAREVFFLEDHVILVEGQEDVMSFREIIAQLDVPLHGEFYGWGVGGASKMRLVAKLLVDLGFKHVAGILDLGQHELQEALGREFSRYRFFLTSMRDVRTKPAKPARDGLLDENFRLRADHVEHVHHLFDLVNEVLRPPG